MKNITTSQIEFAPLRDNRDRIPGKDQGEK
jgi:hypothetical protein